MAWWVPVPFYFEGGDVWQYQLYTPGIVPWGRGGGLPKKRDRERGWDILNKEEEDITYFTPLTHLTPRRRKGEEREERGRKMHFKKSSSFTAAFVWLLLLLLLFT